MEFSLEWYRVFYWTAKLGSLTKAAEQLHITQPAVSHTLKQLETGLGGPLFFRTAKGVTLTGEGEMLFRYVEQGMQLIDVGERKLAEMHNLDYGEISIGASDTLCRHFLLPQLERFHRQYPDIRVKVTNRTTPETLALLKEGRIDFGLVNLPANDAKVELRPSAPLHDCLVGGPAYRELAASPVPIEELHRYPLLLLESGGSTRRYLDEFALACGVKLTPEFELGSLDLLAQFAQSGFGLTVIAREYVADQLAAGQLVEIPLHPPIPARHIGIATLKGVPLSSAASRFLGYLPGR